MLEAARIVSLLLVAVLATVVAYTQDPVRQALVAGVFGVALAVAFLLMQAPGVAMAVMVVSGVAVPVMVLVTVTNVRGGER